MLTHTTKNSTWLRLRSSSTKIDVQRHLTTKNKSKGAKSAGKPRSKFLDEFTLRVFTESHQKTKELKSIFSITKPEIFFFTVGNRTSNFLRTLQFLPFKGLLGPRILSLGGLKTSMATLPSTQALQKMYRLTADKSLSQNFLTDENTCNKIVQVSLDAYANRHHAYLQSTDKAPRKSIEPFTVIEIGPGPGGLTRSLLNALMAIPARLDETLDGSCNPAKDSLMATSAKTFSHEGNADEEGSTCFELYEKPAGDMKAEMQLSRDSPFNHYHILYAVKQLGVVEKDFRFESTLELLRKASFVKIKRLADPVLNGSAIDDNDLKAALEIPDYIHQGTRYVIHGLSKNSKKGEPVPLFNVPRMNTFIGDATTTDMASFVRDLPFELNPTPWNKGPSSLLLLGNLPFNIGTMILINFVEMVSNTVKCAKINELINAHFTNDPMRQDAYRQKVASIFHKTSGPFEFGRAGLYLMLQKELVERIVSSPNCKSYNRLSVMIQRHCEVKNIYHVPSTAFVPRPKVSSCILEAFPHETGIAHSSDIVHAYVLRQAFAQKRKTFFNALLRLFATPAPSDLLRRMEHDLHPYLPIEDILDQIDAYYANNTQIASLNPAARADFHKLFSDEDDNVVGDPTSEHAVGDEETKYQIRSFFNDHRITGKSSRAGKINNSMFLFVLEILDILNKDEVRYDEQTLTQLRPENIPPADFEVVSSVFEKYLRQIFLIKPN